MSSRIYVLAQQKGGVGKTTSTIILGAALAERKHRVLLVDIDPQGALSAGLGIDAESLSETIYHVMINRKLPISSVIVKTEVGCDIVPSNIDLAAAEMNLVSEPGREQILKGKLKAVEDKYDYILIDCPPSLGVLTLNALAAAKGVIVPVQTQFFALRGLELLFDTISKMQERLNPELIVAGILPTIYDSRTTHSKEVLATLQKKYPGQILKTIIPQTIKLPDSAMAGFPITVFNTTSPAATAYRDLAKEIELL
ncbi:MAG: chromosome partitioning protein [bacterium]|nr:MAG: chromosome partitioning protein [bacterium]